MEASQWCDENEHKIGSVGAYSVEVQFQLLRGHHVCVALI